MTDSPRDNIMLDGVLAGKLRADLDDVFQVDSVEIPRKLPPGLTWPIRRLGRKAQEEAERQARQGVILFMGRLLREDSEAVYDIIAERWRAHDYTPLLRRYKGQVTVVAQPGTINAPAPPNPRINILLAIITILSVLFTGAMYECECSPTTLSELLTGLPMMLTIMVILLAHEFGHYFAAKYHRVGVTLPYFIPLPVLSPVGTMGAFIQLRSPFKTKKQLFDIGIAGPLAGLVFAIPLVFYGIATSRTVDITRGPVIAVGISDQIELWDQSPRKIESLQGHIGQINSIAFSPNGKNIVTAGADETVRVWYVDDEIPAHEILRLKHPGKANSVAFSPDGQAIATAGTDQTIRVWDLATGQEIQRLEGHSGEINSVVYSPSGQIILTASSDQTVRLWDAATGQEIKSFEGHTDKVNSAAFDIDIFSLLLGLDPNDVVTAGSDGSTRVWDTTTGKETLRLEGHSGEINSAVFSPPQIEEFIPEIFGQVNHTILTAGADQSVRMWDTTTAKEILRIDNLGEVENADFFPDGRTIVTAGPDNGLRLWNSVTGKEIRYLDEQPKTNINTISIYNYGSALEGNSIFYLMVKYLSRGQLIPSFDKYSDLSFLQEFGLLLAGIIPTGGGTDILMNSIASAAWFGLLVTVINLMPVGQLDGGHIIYTILGDKARWLGMVLVALMFIAGVFWWTGWLVWAILIYLIIGTGHPPPLNDLVELGLTRKIIAYLTLILFILLFMPNPLQPM